VEDRHNVYALSYFSYLYAAKAKKLIMSGIYIHIPFCKKACHYCNFHFSTSLRYKNSMLKAIEKELAERKHYLDNRTVSSVYFGGGTPSLLTADEINSIWKVIKANYELDNDLEITLEANPDDLGPEKLKELKAKTKINRLSIGIQSFRDEDLIYMNRAHSAAEAKECIGNALALGFHSISIDLIYGTPTMDDEAWHQNLRTALAYGIPHISCYALTVEPKTALQHLIAKGKTLEVDEEQTARQFEILVHEASAQGYEQYEISNFCRPPHYARHNSAYWKGAHYLGVGPSAHSFNGISRQWNIANNTKYIKAITQGEDVSETEVLSMSDQYNEFIMTGLRTKWGIDPVHLMENWGESISAAFIDKAQKYILSGYMLREDTRYVLTLQGKLLADSIMSDLFI
jgi:oxygen-independent coproporphyrinogen III oxidase